MAYDTVGSGLANSRLVTALKKEVDFLQTFMDELYTVVVNASSYWQGESYEAFASMLGKYSNYFYNYIDMLQVYIQALDGPTAEALMDLENDARTAFDSIGG